jgi:hypothetical protein
MNQLAQNSDTLDWNTLINATAPRIGANATLGNIISGSSSNGVHYPGIVFFITIISGLGFLVYLLYGGIILMTSGGDPKKVQNGQKTLTNGLIGLIIVFFAYWIVQIVGYVLGLGGITNTFN